MSASNNTSVSSDPFLRPIALARQRDLWIASPADGEIGAHRGFVPFHLPPVPRSLIDWLIVGGRQFWNSRHRCLAALLLIDCKRGGWTLHLPRQHCGTDLARWSTTANELPQYSGSLRIGGSFQTINHGPAADAVPVAGGFHFTLCMSSPNPLNAYVRYGEEILAINAAALIANDWADNIDAARPRIQLA